MSRIPESTRTDPRDMRIRLPYFSFFVLYSAGYAAYHVAMAGKPAEERKARPMLRLLGLLSLGHLIFGGRRRFCRGLLFGALLGYLANRDFDGGRVAEDVRRKARKAERAAREAVRAARREIRKVGHAQRTEEIHEKIDARKAEREERLKAIHAGIEARKARKEQTREPETTVRALPVSGLHEAKEIRELAEDPERDARTAAMAANVPTIDFPEGNGKYDSSRKYGYAQ